jgi:hypothetical protein
MRADGPPWYIVVDNVVVLLSDERNLWTEQQQHPDPPLPHSRLSSLPQRLMVMMNHNLPQQWNMSVSPPDDS